VRRTALLLLIASGCAAPPTSAGRFTGVVDGVVRRTNGAPAAGVPVTVTIQAVEDPQRFPHHSRRPFESLSGPDGRFSVEIDATFGPEITAADCRISAGNSASSATHIMVLRAGTDGEARHVPLFEDGVDLPSLRFDGSLRAATIIHVVENCKVRGRVVAPAAGIHVGYLLDTGRGGRINASLLTDANGRFETTVRPAAYTQAALVVAGPGVVPAWRPMESFPEAGTVDLGDIAIKRLRTVERVIDAGPSLAGERILVMPLDSRAELVPESLSHLLSWLDAEIATLDAGGRACVILESGRRYEATILHDCVINRPPVTVIDTFTVGDAP